MINHPNVIKLFSMYEIDAYYLGTELVQVKRFKRSFIKTKENLTL